MSSLLGIVLGAGSSIDRIPALARIRFTHAGHRLAFVNRAICARAFHGLTDHANNICVGYNSFAPKNDIHRMESNIARLARYGQFEGKLWLDKTWMKYLPWRDKIGETEWKSTRPLHNSAQQAAKILVRYYGCNKLWLLGTECKGPHCQTLPALDTTAVAPDRAFQSGAAKYWASTLEDLGVPVATWPADSLLVEEGIVKEVIDWESIYG